MVSYGWISTFRCCLLPPFSVSNFYLADVVRNLVIPSKPWWSFQRSAVHGVIKVKPETWQLFVSKSVHFIRYITGCDSLRAGESVDRIPVGARFSALVQTGPGAHPASYTVGTRSFPGVKRPGRGADHPPLCNAEVKERVEAYLYFLCGPSWPVLGWTLLYFTLLHFTLLHFTSLHFTLLHFIYFTSLHFTLRYFTSLNLLYFTSLHFTLLHLTSFHFT